MRYTLIALVTAIAVLSLPSLPSPSVSVSAQAGEATSTATPNPGAIETQVAAKIYATLTAIAKTTATTTATPTTRTPVGLGISRSTMQKALEARGMIFIEQGTDKAGIPYVAVASKGLTVLLYGLPETLTAVSMKLEFALLAGDVSSPGVSHLLNVFDLLRPGNTEMGHWFSDYLGQSTFGPVVRKFGQIELTTLGIEKDGIMLIFLLPLGNATPTLTPTRTRTPTNTPTPQPTPVPQDVMVNVQNKWEVTLLSTRRDKTIWGAYGSAETAFGVWATLIFRVRNLQTGSDYMGKSYRSVLFADGQQIEYSIVNSVEDKAQWFYSCCDSTFTLVGPGEEKTILITFDVPEQTTTLIYRMTAKGIPASTAFLIPAFDQIPPRKMK